MTRIIALVGLALVIVAVASTSALACITPVGTPSVSAPNGQGSGQGTFRCLPNNKGTQKAASESVPSPAVNPECSNNQ